MNKSDKRFIDSYNVADTLDDSVNLAAIPWEDCEQLITELFQAEISTSGGEVKVTQASRGGGVDVIALIQTPFEMER